MDAAGTPLTCEYPPGPAVLPLHHLVYHSDFLCAFSLAFTLQVAQLRVKAVTTACVVPQALDCRNTCVRQCREALTESCPIFSARQAAAAN